MSTIVGLIQFTLLCVTMLLIAVAILLAWPDSKLGSRLRPPVYWGIAVLCVLYVAMPCDLLPEVLLGPLGLPDDVLAILTAITAANKAMKAKESLKAQCDMTASS